MDQRPRVVAAVVRPTDTDPVDGQWSMSEADQQALASGLGEWLADAETTGPTSSITEPADRGGW